MIKIPDQNLVEQALEQDVVLPHRYYMGMSGLGHPCDRKIWYDFHWAYTNMVPARIKRIFERGDLEEERVVKDLRKAGMEVTNQQEEICDSTFHIRGHIDGLVCNVPGARTNRHLLEIKTMNDKRFNEYLKLGLIKTNKGYFIQINLYMGFLNLTRCLFIVTNKDTEERSYKRYKFDKYVFEEARARGFNILSSPVPPKRVSDNPAWFECKMCPAIQICHYKHKMEHNCRTCDHLMIDMHGLFRCEKFGMPLTEGEQINGCEEHTPCLN